MLLVCIVQTHNKRIMYCPVVAEANLGKRAGRWGRTPLDVENYAAPGRLDDTIGVTAYTDSAIDCAIFFFLTHADA